MAKRRGFFAELQYQSQQAEKRRRQQEAAAQRARAAAQRDAERALRAFRSAQTVAARASTAERKAAEKEMARLHLEARVAEVGELNANLAAQYADIDGLLAATLEVDDYVDLAALRVTTVNHPPFEPGVLAIETEAVLVPQRWNPPVWQEPAPPAGLGAAFGGKKRHEKIVTEARAAFEAAYAEWSRIDEESRHTYQRKLAHRGAQEVLRQRKLAEAEATYRAECEAREAQAADRNAKLDSLINGLAFDVESAIDEYVGIVLANSVYPAVFSVEHDHAFALHGRELTLVVTVPEPSNVPAIKEHKYVKARDEITATSLPVREQKDRYANAVWQVAVRTFHEVFEADRSGKIHSIALTVGVQTVAVATGLPIMIPLVIAAAGRDTFNKFDLSNVIPKATLEHLGAALSKSPFDLIPADTSLGVRASRGV
jgi:restriction system protein